MRFLSKKVKTSTILWWCFVCPVQLEVVFHFLHPHLLPSASPTIVGLVFAIVCTESQLWPWAAQPPGLGLKKLQIGPNVTQLKQNHGWALPTHVQYVEFYICFIRLYLVKDVTSKQTLFRMQDEWIKEKLDGLVSRHMLTGLFIFFPKRKPNFCPGSVQG